MNQMSTKRRAQVVRSLVEGNSIRSTVRMTGAAKNTVTKLLVDLGEACLDYQDRTLVGLTCRRIQCDEIWSFCYAKQKNVPDEMKDAFGVGDVWTWTALDADTKLVPCWHVGNRAAEDAYAFINDLAGRLRHRVRLQITTDGHKPYLEAIEGAFGCEVDYGMLIKVYGCEPEGERRYSPPVCLAAEKTVITGQPDPAHICTSFVERQNLTMRMAMRRFTRLTNGFSKKVTNHMCAVALHFMHYNFGRPHTTLTKRYPTTPAMVAGVADHVWTAEEIVGLLDPAQAVGGAGLLPTPPNPPHIA